MKVLKHFVTASRHGIPSLNATIWSYCLLWIFFWEHKKTISRNLPPQPFPTFFFFLFQRTLLWAIFQNQSPLTVCFIGQIEQKIISLGAYGHKYSVWAFRKIILRKVLYTLSFVCTADNVYLYFLYQCFLFPFVSNDVPS